MWWIFSWLSNYLALVLIEVLKCGHMPEHVAIILDGNRRYAKLRNKPSHYGHTIGGNKLKVILDWCQIIGIKEITVYAFSIENFKRSKEEVDEVFDLIENLVIDCVNNHPETMLRLVGNLELLPQYLKKSLSQYSLKSIGDKPFVVNLAIAYTARDEITNAINLINEGIKNGCLLLDDIDEDLLNQCLYVQSEPDILLRTSGEKRLSDFLLWQLQSAQVNFVKKLWPEFNVWLLLACIFQYQMKRKYVAYKSKVNVPYEENPRKKIFIKQLQNDRLQMLHHYANS